MVRLRRAWLAGMAIVMGAFLLGPLAAPIAAQSTTGTIHGVVRDDQNAVVPGATVTIRNVGTGQARTAVTGQEGRIGCRTCRWGSTS